MHSEENQPTKNRGIWLVVWSETSTIGKAAESALFKGFDIIQTSKDNQSGERIYLNISDIQSIKWFIKEFMIKYPEKKIKVLFLNAGKMIIWDTLHRGNFFVRANEWDQDINTHMHNIVLVEYLQTEWIIDKETKIIYNASTQIFAAREWFEDYARLKSIVSNMLLNNKALDITVLALSMVKWSYMTSELEKIMKEKWNDIDLYIKKNMPEWQPTLNKVTKITEKIIENKEITKGKIVVLDWWRIKTLGIEIPSECIYFDEESDSFKAIQK